VAKALLEIRDLRKVYGSHVAVNDLSLSVEAGEFVTIVGPSGCGKTTTLRMIAGFVEPDGGEIILDGKSVQNEASHRRGAVMVFQNYALFPHMTVFDNVGFGLRMRKVPRAELASRVADALAMVRLGEYGGRYPRQLSGGQQQRVALARAIVCKPKLLLLDEPLSNLDAKLRQDLRTEFAEIHRLSGTTTIFVTHDLDEAFSLSSRVAVMSNGQLQQYGQPQEIFLKPATAFVADFVGHRNLIEGEVLAEAGAHTALRIGGATVKVPPGHAVGTTRRFAIPVSALQLGQMISADNVLSATISRVVYLGNFVSFTASGDGFDFKGQIHSTEATRALEAGNAVRIGWNVSDMVEVPN
jgi:putative spermidine/putrescine transport system ATP-binding protein